MGVIALRTVVPSVLAFLAPVYFIGNGWIGLAIGVPIATAWLVVMVWVEWIRAATRDEWRRQLEDVLETFETLADHTTRRALEAKRDGKNGGAALLHVYDHEGLMNKVVQNVYGVIREHHIEDFRVTFVECEGDEASIRYWWPTEPPGVIPHLEGVVRQAAQTRDMVVISSNEVGVFQSLVCLPVLRDEGHPFGCLTIESQTPMFFQNTGTARRGLRKRLGPYLWLIRALYTTREVVTQAAAVPPP